MKYKSSAPNTGKALLKWVWTELLCLRSSAHSRAVINRFWPQVTAAISLRVNSALTANAASFQYDQSLVFVFFSLHISITLKHCNLCTKENWSQDECPPFMLVRQHCSFPGSCSADCAVPELSKASRKTHRMTPALAVLGEAAEI